MLDNNYIMHVYVIIYPITRNTVLKLEGKKEQYRNHFLLKLRLTLHPSLDSFYCFVREVCVEHIHNFSVSTISLYIFTGSLQLIMKTIYCTFLH